MRNEVMTSSPQQQPAGRLIRGGASRRIEKTDREAAAYVLETMTVFTPLWE